MQSTAGVVGLGECSDSGDTRVLAAAVREARVALVGGSLESGRALLRSQLASRRQSALPSSALAWSTALGGLESALDDLTARHAGIPLAIHLGMSRPQRVQVYANLNRAFGGGTVLDLVAGARQATAQGFAAIKIAPFDTNAANGDAVSAGLAIVDAVQEVLSDRTALMIDFHFRLDDQSLLRVLPELASRRVFWIEDAVHPSDLQRLVWLRGQTDLPLAAGEHEWDAALVEAACGSGAVDYWLMDPKHVGGPEATKRLLARTGDVAVSFHNPSGPVGTLHAAHLLGLSERTSWLEYAWGDADRAQFLAPGESVDGGMLLLPEGPGIGAELAVEPTRSACEHD